MIKLVASAILFICVLQSISAQQKNITPLRFKGMACVGLLNGQTGQSVLLETTLGVTKNNWFGGLGTGLDYYGTRTIPLFASVQKRFGSNKTVPFAFANGGVALGWATDNQKANKFYEYKALPGAYFDGGIGVIINTCNGRAILLSAGYSGKQVVEKATLLPVRGWPMPVAGNNFETYKYQYRRIVIKVGFQF